MKHRKWIIWLLVPALTLTLLAGCGQRDRGLQTAAPDPAPAADDTEKQDPPAAEPDPGPAPAAEEGQLEGESPAESAPETPEEDEPQTLAGETAGEPLEEPAPDPQPEPAPEPQPAPQPESAPAPEPEPESEGESVMAGDTYTISVTLEGGTGRATVESPATLHYRNGTCWATIVWSSPNFDYMKVDGQRYDPINTEGNSTFEIPVSAFDQPLAVIADTVAMSEPHEVEYTLTFDYASMEDA